MKPHRLEITVTGWQELQFVGSQRAANRFLRALRVIQWESARRAILAQFSEDRLPRRRHYIRRQVGNMSFPAKYRGFCDKFAMKITITHQQL